MTRITRFLQAATAPAPLLVMLLGGAAGCGGTDRACVVYSPTATESPGWCYLMDDSKAGDLAACEASDSSAGEKALATDCPDGFIAACEYDEPDQPGATYWYEHWNDTQATILCPDDRQLTCVEGAVKPSSGGKTCS